MNAIVAKSVRVRATARITTAQLLEALGLPATATLDAFQSANGSLSEVEFRWDQEGPLAVDAPEPPKEPRQAKAPPPTDPAVLALLEEISKVEAKLAPAVRDGIRLKLSMFRVGTRTPIAKLTELRDALVAALPPQTETPPTPAEDDGAPL